MNISMTAAAEALLQELIESGHGEASTIVEQALQYFSAQQSLDTAIGFPEMTEAEIILENEVRWQKFQQNPQGVSQVEVEDRFSHSNSKLHYHPTLS